MDLQTLLSPWIGVPLAMLAGAMLFRLEAERLGSFRVTRLLNASALGVTAVVVVLVLARFVEYA